MQSNYLKEHFAEDLEKCLEQNKKFVGEEEELMVKSLEDALLLSEFRLQSLLKSIYEAGKGGS